MSEQSTPNATEQLQKKIDEMNNVLRVEQNTVTAISGMEIKGGDSPAIAELLGYHQGFINNLKTQLEALLASLPKPTVELAEVKV